MLGIIGAVLIADTCRAPPIRSIAFIRAAGLRFILTTATVDCLGAIHPEIDTPVSELRSIDLTIAILARPITGGDRRLDPDENAKINGVSTVAIPNVFPVSCPLPVDEARRAVPTTTEATML